ncbi:P-loop containing nucleoside triphosphate hydrolase protein [Earliella scabrosa]|nr:P-loop containing nucleoside triphosphate hydrolase protein [Earliella scabrosa]
MSPAFSRLRSHDQETAHSYALLDAAREAARVSRGYDSVATRLKVTEEFRERMGGKSPHAWQLDVTEALLLGLDCTVIAGTGCGKTMPFVMPAFVETDKLYIIISPLNALETDQERRFTDLKVPAAAVNRETYSTHLLELLSDPKFARRIGAFIIDEAHCIPQWGHEFRKEYSTSLPTLRALVPCPVPVLATSATLTPVDLAEARSRLGIVSSRSFHLNLGNDRPNIKQEMRFMKSANDYAALDFIVEGAKARDDLPRAIIFVNALQKCHGVAHRLREIAGPALRHEIGILHAKRAASARASTWERFRRGDLRVLVATEAAAMGMDVPDIELAVQFGIPQSLGIWLQRAGRAGRSPSVQARAVMVVEKSAVQRVGGGNTKKSSDGQDPEDDSESSDSEFEEEEERLDPDEKDKPKYKKTIEESLRAWIETEGCRRKVADEYFDNPPRTAGTFKVRHCDSSSPSDFADTRAEGGGVPMGEAPDGPGSEDENTPPERCSNNVVPRTPSRHAGGQARPRQSPQRRAGQHLKNVKTALAEWRREIRRSKYKHTSLKTTNILPDVNLRTIASNRRGIKTVEDLRAILRPPWALLDIHGAEVLQLISSDVKLPTSRRRHSVRPLEKHNRLKHELRRRHGGGMRSGPVPPRIMEVSWVTPQR